MTGSQLLRYSRESKSKYDYKKSYQRKDDQDSKIDYFNLSQKVDNKRKKSTTIRITQSKGQKKKEQKSGFLFLLFKNVDGPSFWQSKKILRISI